MRFVCDSGDHVLLEYEDLCELESPRYVTVRTLAMSGLESIDSPKACLSSKMIRELQSISLQSDSEVSHIAGSMLFFTRWCYFVVDVGIFLLLWLMVLDFQWLSKY